VEISKEMQDRAKAGLKLAAGSATIHSLTCWRTPVGRSAKLVSSAELALTLNAQAVAQPGPPLKQHTDQRRLS
jgi:hypothetical protein